MTFGLGSVILTTRDYRFEGICMVAENAEWNLLLINFAKIQSGD